MSELEFPIKLHKKQRLALDSPATMQLYGGAGGGGKSHYGRIAFILICLAVPGALCYLVRETMPELKKNHYVGATSFPVLLASLIEIGYVKIINYEIQFANGPNSKNPFDGGSRIIPASLAHEKDLNKFQGPEITALWVEESCNIQQAFIEWLLSRLRMSDSLKVKGTMWEHKLPWCLFTSNPLGVSVDWHMKKFVNDKKPLKVYKEVETVIDDLGKAIEVVRLIQYVPAGLSDNPSINKAQYLANLAHLSPQLQEAIIRGIWGISFGAFWPELSKKIHLRSFEPPEHWARFITHDWGSYAPCATIWWAVADGETGNMPRGSLYAYREWYLCDERNKKLGVRMSNRQIAKGIYERSDRHDVTTWTDSIPFQDRGGIPMHVEYSDEGIHLEQADMSKKEVSASMVRGRLVADPKPTMYFHADCEHTYRTMVAMQHDPKNPEKPIGSEDHLPDCVMHAARVWSEVQDKTIPDAQKIEEELNAPVTLLNVSDGLSILMDG
jgi:hypothetical protein